jgi:hypothetical protein
MATAAGALKVLTTPIMIATSVVVPLHSFRASVIVYRDVAISLREIFLEILESDA